MTSPPVNRVTGGGATSARGYSSAVTLAVDVQQAEHTTQRAAVTTAWWKTRQRLTVSLAGGGAASVRGCFLAEIREALVQQATNTIQQEAVTIAYCMTNLAAIKP